MVLTHIAQVMPLTLRVIFIIATNIYSSAELMCIIHVKMQILTEYFLYFDKQHPDEGVLT